jgi:signal transduction histidine kinase
MNAVSTLRTLALLAVVLPATLFGLSAWISYEDHVEDAREQLERTVDIVHEHAIKVFETHDLTASQVDQILFGLTEDQIRQREQPINRRLKTLTDSLPQVSDLWVLDRHGRPLVTANFFPVPRNLDLSDREYFRFHREQNAASSEKVFVSEILKGRADQRATFFQISTARMIGDTKFDLSAPKPDFAGVTAVSVEPLYFQRYYQQVAGDRELTFTLTRTDGAVLARFPGSLNPLEQLPASSPFFEIILAHPTRGLYTTLSAFDRVERLVAYRRLPNHPVYVSAGLEKTSITRAWWGDLSRHLIFGVPASLGLALLSFIAMRYTQREREALDQLRTEAQRREQTEAQLRQAQKMEAVGRLTGGIAHDFNNLLTIVLGNLETMQRRLPELDHRLRRSLTNAIAGAQRAAALTNRLLVFSRQSPLEPITLDPNRVVAGMSELLRRTLSEQIAVETVLAGGIWTIRADANQLENALLNLAVNARDAMPDGGKLTIETANAHLDEAYAGAHTEVAPGQYVVICVTDTGIGMPPEVIANAFEPFFTTKPAGQGTGLGLSQVYGFLKQSGGSVGIYTEVGHGTTIKLYFPRHHSTGTPVIPASGELGAPALVQSRRHETILVVEDEELVRQFSVETLQEAGYRVLAAENGTAGLALLQANPEVALLFTDVVLTGIMNGRELADAALRERPDLKVLFTTGYTRNAIIHQGRLDDGVNFIGKPFTASALCEKVARLLQA